MLNIVSAKSIHAQLTLLPPDNSKVSRLVADKEPEVAFLVADAAVALVCGVDPGESSLVDEGAAVAVSPVGLENWGLLLLLLLGFCSHFVVVFILSGLFL